MPFGGSASIFARSVRIWPAMDSISRWCYARTLYRDANATLDDLREAVTTLEDAERITRRVFGGAHPLTKWIELELQKARATLDTHETPSDSA